MNTEFHILGNIKVQIYTAHKFMLNGIDKKSIQKTTSLVESSITRFITMWLNHFSFKTLNLKFTLSFLFKACNSIIDKALFSNVRNISNIKVYLDSTIKNFNTLPGTLI